MKKLPFVLYVILSAAPMLRAQVVADGATNTLSNITNSFTGDVTVGTNGSFTLLILSDNALLTNSANGVISRNATARSNVVHLVSSTARWLMNGSLFVGSNGGNATLVVSNGAFVRANAGIIGRQTASGSNVVLVTGAGSLWSNVAGLSGVGLTVGGSGSGNQLIVSNGGRVVNALGSGSIGSNGSNNVARVTGPGSVWSNFFALNINSIGAGNGNNGLVIEDGGQVFNDDGLINGLNGSSNNFAFITGNGAVWNNSRDLYLGSTVRTLLVVSNGGTVLTANSYVGSTVQALVTGGGSLWSHRHDLVLGGRLNALTVTDAGGVVNSNGYVGGVTGADLSSSNNLVVVTGAGSTWSNWANVFLGFAGSGNRLVVSNGATVTASNVFVGFQSPSLNNRLTVDGGTLRVTNAVGTGVLDVRRGTNVLNAGLVEADRLIVTNTAGKFEHNGGALSVKNTAVANVQLFRVGNGVNPATFTLAGNGSHTFVNGLSISANAALIGNGTIGNTVTVLSGGTLAPGASIGKIVLGNPPSLQGVVSMEISKNGAALTNDQVQVTGTLTYGGSLTVSNLGPTALTAGNRFQLFSAGSYAGSFGTISLPPLNPGLDWTNKVLVDGSIEVLDRTPVVTTLAASSVVANTARLNGLANPKGTAAAAWFEFGTTTNYGNVTAPQPLGSGMNNINFNQLVSGLTGSTHHFRAVASNTFVVVFGSDQSFSIGPIVTTQPANPVIADLAGLNGTANPNGVSTIVWFEWGTTTNYGNATVLQPLGSGTNNANFTQFLLDLPAGTYHFRAAASNSLDVVFGTDREFSIGPAVQTLPAGIPEATSARLNGVANPQGVGTSAWFEWGTTTNFGNITPPQPLGGGMNNVSFSEVVTGLTVGVTYHFRAVASNSIAAVTGTNQSLLMFDPFAAEIYLKASNTGSNDFFGTSVAISGDTIVVGARFESSSATGVNGNQSDNSALNAGAAYVFVRNGTTWIQQAYLKASNTDSNDSFGVSVSISGDTIVVGALNESSSATGVNGNQNNNTVANSGAAYVFVREGTNWTQQAYLKASNTGTNDTFGNSVAVAGDTVLVGASAEASNVTGVNGNQGDNSASGSGAAYVFVRSGTNWTQQAYLKASNTESGDRFGVRVAVSGDTAVVGADLEGSNATGVNGDQTNNLASLSGAAYVFARNGTNWTQQAYLKASNTGAFEQFGIALAISGDTVVVGSPVEASNATGVNGDQTNNTASGSGAAYVFVRNGTNWTQQAYLKASNTDPFDSFGIAVALSGDIVVVGALREDSSAVGINGDDTDNTATDSGAAYVFVREGTIWAFQSYLKASNTDPFDNLGAPGQAVAVSGDTVVVGARQEDSNATGVNGDHSDNSAPDSGAAYIFEFPPLPPPALTIVESGPAQITLSWTPPTPGFALQESLTLSPVAWSNAPSGATNPITLPTTDQTKFFRLFKP